jgi:hypothetical protein
MIRNPIPSSWTVQVGTWSSSDARYVDAEKLYGMVTIDFTQPLPTGPVVCRLGETGGIQALVSESDGSPTDYVNFQFFAPGELHEPNQNAWPWQTSGDPLRVPCRTYARSHGADLLEVEGIPPGEYEIWVWHPGSGGVRASQEGEHVVQVRPRQVLTLDPIHLPRMPYLTGWIRGGLLRALEHGLALYYTGVDDHTATLMTDTSVRPKAGGRFRTRFAPIGRFRALVRAGPLTPDFLDGLRAGISNWVEFETAEGHDTVVVFTLRETPRLRVSLENPDGSVAQGYRVTVTQVSSDDPVRFSELFVLPPMQEDDRFWEAGFVPRGSYLIEATAHGNDVATVKRVVELREDRIYEERIEIAGQY